MALFSFFKACVGFLIGAGAGGGLTWLCIRLYAAGHPLPAQQLGDMFVTIAVALLALAVTALMALLGGIAGVILIQHLG